MESKVCTACKIDKELSNYYKQNKKNANGDKYIYYPPKCKECMVVDAQGWAKSNPDKVKEISIRDKTTKVDYHKAHKKRYYDNNLMEVKKRKKQWDRDNADKILKYNSNRRAFRINLPDTITDDDIALTKELFGENCILTNRIDTHFEHFIPLSWGHGGTYVGNVYFLCSKLNVSKFNKNPFEWIKEKEVSEQVDMQKWDFLVETLANQNGLTVEEFTNYVYWCDSNRREVEEIGSESSMELWSLNCAV